MKTKSLKINFIMNSILTMSTLIFPLITYPYISRILTPSGVGKVSFATSLISYFNIFAQLGIPTYGIRACAKIRDNKQKLTRTVHELLVINIVMNIFSYVMLFFAIIYIPRLHEDKILYVIMSSSIFLNSIGMEWLYKALEQYTYITIRSIIFKFIALFAIFFLIHEESDYILYGCISIFSAFSSNVLNFLYAHKYIDIKFTNNYKFKQHIKMTLVFFSMSCATTIYTNLDTIMLGFMKTDVDVGYYSIAIKIKAVLVCIVTSLGADLLPRTSYYVEHKLFDEFQKITNKALNFVVLLSFPLMLYFIFFAKNFIVILFGEAYAQSVLPMQITMPTLLIIGITNVLGIQMLVPLEKEKIVLLSEIVGAIVDIILNIILIPQYASVGAAIGTLLAEIAVLLIQFYALNKEASEAFREIQYNKILFSLLLSCFSSFWLVYSHLSNLILPLVSFFLFFGVYGITLIILKEKQTTIVVKQIKSYILKI